MSDLGFAAMLEERGIDLLALKPLYESRQDCIEFIGPQKVAIGPSPIDGTGLFAKQPLCIGEKIAVARAGIWRTPAGRYTNHSDSPNAWMAKIGDEWYLLARSHIDVGEEILIDYRQAMQLHSE